jgi:hypothetical protein
MSIEIREVKSSSDLAQFIRFPFELYKNQPNWIPPLLQSERETLSAATNPAFEHATVTSFTAWESDKMVGRITGLINDLETEHIGEKHARFGWIDFVDDLQVSAALTASVENWAKSKNCLVVKGPFGFNQLDKNGMLTEGFDTLGTVGTIYNYPYYPVHLEKLGYEKDLEWVEVDMKMTTYVPERVAKFTQMVEQRYGLKFLQPRTQDEMTQAAKALFQLMMDTYKNLPGFVPIPEKQRDHYLRQYVRFLRRDFICIVLDAKNQPIGMGVTMPSLSKAMKKANGRLFPFGILHLLAARYWNDTADLALIGVEEEWRKKGVPGLIFYKIAESFLKAGIRRIQINPMLEFNTHVLALWKDFDHHIYKRRKTFRKRLTVDGGRGMGDVGRGTGDGGDKDVLLYNNLILDNRGSGYFCRS